MKIKVRAKAGIAFYLAAFVGGAIFSQAFVSPVSAAVFRFIMLLPLSALVPFAVVPFIKVRAIKARGVTVRGEKSNIGFKIVNRGLAPLSVCIAEMSFGGSSDSGKKKETFSVPPFSADPVLIETECGHVGRTTVTVDRIGVCDPLRLICVSKTCSVKMDMFVIPRIVGNTRVSVSVSRPDNTGGETKTGDGDYSGVRGYIPGDRLKDIHWKLSSKGDELFSVERNESGAGAMKIRAYIPDDRNVADAAADMLLTICYGIVRNGNLCTVVSDGGEFEIKCARDIDEAAVYISDMCSTAGNRDCNGCSVFLVPFTDMTETSGITEKIRKSGDGPLILLADVSEIIPEKNKGEYLRAFDDAVRMVAGAGLETTVVRYVP